MVWKLLDGGISSNLKPPLKDGIKIKGKYMFVKAIETVTQFTRPMLTISRNYGSTEVEPGCATIIVVNEEGWLLTCRHVAQLIVDAETINQKFTKFKQEVAALSSGKHYKTQVKALEKKYGYVKGKGIIAQLKNQFNIVDRFTSIQVIMHKDYDIALVKLDGFSKLSYNSYPVFAKDTTRLKQGMSLCRLGYPYPEFSNFSYDAANDDIVWTNAGNHNTPLFPIDGILTRHLVDAKKNRVVGIELSTPGLRGQSGGPLFDVDGIVCGIQSATHSLPLGFDQENREIKVKGVTKKVNDYSFIHLGNCVHVDVIKEFMNDNGIKYNVG